LHTDRLIQQLAADTAPVRRLPAPWRRAAIWFAIALPYVAAVMLVHSESVSLIHSGSMPVDLSRMLVDRQFIIEELAILATAITAVLAAFYSVVPGTDRRILLIPLLPLTIWLVSLGAGCARDWIRLGAKGLTLRADWACLPPAMLIGIVPVLAIVIMLRRGAPLYPRTTLAVGTLAAAALGNFALRIYHVGDVSIVLLVWHFGAVVVLSLITGWIGRLVLNWKTAKLAASH
jgi:hypothetical protein